MRIGIVSYWFNRGQGVVGRHIRSALDTLGHDTYVLARRTKETFAKPSFVATDDVWAQTEVTAGSGFDMTRDDYVSWARANRLEVVFCFQNLQFAEVSALRELGVRTIGTFMWEAFGPEHAAGAIDAYDVIYSLTSAEPARYRAFGIESPYVPWGIHPELLQEAPIRARSRWRIPGRRPVVFYYPGGYLTPRKPTAQVIEAFSKVRSRRARLLIKVQDGRAGQRLRDEVVQLDPRIEVSAGDLPQREHLRLFGSCDVSLAPSRWEGLGLHLYEAAAFGLPTITSDGPPMNEMVTHGLDGLLVESTSKEEVSPGVPILEPDVTSIARCVDEMLDDDRRAELARGTELRRRERSWERTVAAYAELLRDGGGSSR